MAADWSRDGESLAISRTVEGRHRVEYPIGTILHETDGRPPIYVRVSAKGDQVAFADYDKDAGDYAVILAGPTPAEANPVARLARSGGPELVASRR